MKTLLFRLGFTVPLAMFSVYVLLAVIGIIASVVGAGPFFYCTVFCKTGVILFLIAVGGVTGVQVGAHIRKQKTS